MRQRPVVVEAVGTLAEPTVNNSRRTGSSSPQKGCTIEDEVGSFFQQLWHIPWHLPKGCPRVSPIK
jgi:hypothetical protein